MSPFGAEGLTSNQHSRRSSEGQPLLLNNLLRFHNQGILLGASRNHVVVFMNVSFSHFPSKSCDPGPPGQVPVHRQSHPAVILAQFPHIFQMIVRQFEKDAASLVQ